MFISGNGFYLGSDIYLGSGISELLKVNIIRD
jgi:hypothetical protein